jgi:hypothetical protein
MRRIGEVLRLKYELGLSESEIACQSALQFGSDSISVQQATCWGWKL